MDRLTFDGCFCEIAQCTEFPCEMGICSPRQVWERLKAYEDAEEQGLIVRLPCKVGDGLWWVDEESAKVKFQPHGVAGIIVRKDGIYIEDIDGAEDKYPSFPYCFLFEHEAEAALKESVEQ